jgi:hypothetical protein
MVKEQGDADRSDYVPGADVSEAEAADATVEAASEGEFEGSEVH